MMFETFRRRLRRWFRAPEPPAEREKPRRRQDRGPVPEVSRDAPPVQEAQVVLPGVSPVVKADQEKVDLVIGLDFGTAGTKVVIRSPFFPGRPAVAVRFGQLGHSSSPYLLPTRVYVGSGGGVSLDGEEGDSQVADLKLCLLARRSDQIALPVAYLALVLREARTRFLSGERDTYNRFDVRWSLNLGIPSAGYDDLTVRETFRRAARAAWYLSVGDSEITYDRATEGLHLEAGQSFDPGIPIEVVPEVVAQALGYARSHLRESGLHLLVDVGATTLDICGFVLHERESQDRYELLTTTVDRLGTLELHKQRLVSLRCQTASGGETGELDDPLMPLPRWPAEYHPGCSCEPRDIDGQFRDEATRVVMRHLLDLRRHRDPRSPRWQTGLPVFLCGGGSGADLFNRAVGEADWRFREATQTAGLRQRRLPEPDDLTNEDVSDGLFHRLSVAYGLSFMVWDIGGMSPPHEIDDVSPPLPPRDIGDNFVSKDQV